MVLDDGAVTDDEAQFLLKWLNANRHVATQWPANRLYTRVREMLVDRTLDIDEQGELLELLHGMVGGPVPVGERVASFSSTLPLCVPPPAIEFRGRQFVLTGKFATGSRKQCEAAVTMRGGLVKGSLSRSTSYLVIGVMGSADWLHSTHGRKIEEAVGLRSQGHTIGIVSEEHWARALERAPTL